MRRILTLLSLVLAFTLLTAACGDDDETTTAGSDPGDDTTADADADADDVDDLDDDDTVVVDADDLPDDEPTADDTGNDLPIGGGPYPIADLFIFYFDGAGNQAEYRLACLGDTATFTGEVPDGVDAAAACLAIGTDEARMLLDPNITVDRVCTELFGGPEIATVGGILDDVEVDFEINRINGCGIDDWARVFAGLVPPVA
ncbi:MAG: hypothetical protein AAF081_08405 [Actinomycetota bacterium]